jgi:hypothetical protein
MEGIMANENMARPRTWGSQEKADAVSLEFESFVLKYPDRSKDSWRIQRNRLLSGAASFVDKRINNGKTRIITDGSLAAKVLSGNKEKVDTRAVVAAAEEELASVTVQAEIEKLRSSYRAAMRKLSQREDATQELVQAVYQAATEAAASMELPAVPARVFDRRDGDPETAILLLSDWQLGKITPTYNSDTCAERIKLLAEKVESLVAIQRADHPVTDLRVYLLGDLVEGEDIFPGQAHLIDASLYNQTFRGAEILAGLVRRLAGTFENIKVVGCIGNHGRLGRKGTFHPESNADAMMYKVASMLVKDVAHVEWVETISKGERAWFGTDEIYGKRWFLFHGDQVGGGFAGFPWYGFGKKIQGWNMTVAPFDYSVAGHFHTPVRMYLNGIVHWNGGSTESSNTYAQEQLASAGEPCQWLLFQHPTGVSAEYLIRLTS